VTLLNNTVNSIIKLLGAVLVAIFSLWLINALFFGAGNGISMGFNGRYDGGQMYMGSGAGAFGTAGTLSFILLFLIKILFILFIVGLVIGIAIAVKNNLLTDDEIQQIKRTFTAEKTLVTDDICSICGKELDDEWKVCPYCGKEKEEENA
jgi:hypothetical protein